MKNSQTSKNSLKLACVLYFIPICSFLNYLINNTSHLNSIKYDNQVNESDNKENKLFLKTNDDNSVFGSMQQTSSDNFIKNSDTIDNTAEIEEIPESTRQSKQDKSDIKINVSPERKEELKKQSANLIEKYNSIKNSKNPEDEENLSKILNEINNIQAQMQGFISNRVMQVYNETSGDDINSQLSLLREKNLDFFKKEGIDDENIQKQVILSVKNELDKQLSLYVNNTDRCKFNDAIDGVQKAVNKVLREEIKNAAGNEADTNTDLSIDLGNIDKNIINKLIEHDFNYYYNVMNKELGYTEDETEQNLADYKNKCSNLQNKFYNGEITKKEFIDEFKKLAAKDEDWDKYHDAKGSRPEKINPIQHLYDNIFYYIEFADFCVCNLSDYKVIFYFDF